uniref:Peptidase metallopeptidase domain-containing protein n=1 Tax=Acrobeloides nanus TaxID=290746 RepID=A0A914DYS1_9BILA
MPRFVVVFFFFLPTIFECFPQKEILQKFDAKAPLKLATPKRCGNKDEGFSGTPGKTVYTWNFSSLPKGISEDEFRRILHQAFTAWEVVVPVDFIEVNSSQSADFQINFERAEERWPSDSNRTIIAETSQSSPVKISISQDEDWALFEDENPKFDLYYVLEHSLGHILGLSHSTDPESVMYHILERNNEETPREDLFFFDWLIPAIVTNYEMMLMAYDR